MVVAVVKVVVAVKGKVVMAARHYVVPLVAQQPSSMTVDGMSSCSWLTVVVSSWSSCCGGFLTVLKIKANV